MQGLYTIEQFPELLPVQKAWKEIRDEAMKHIDSFYMVGADVPDERNTKNKWKMMPVKPATDDINLDIEQGGKLTEQIEEWQDEFPRLREICEAVPNCKEYCLSLLEPGGHIASHSHGRNNVSCILGLDVPDFCTLRVGSETAHYENGKFVIFNFREKHEAWNQSDKNRLVLLISLPNRHEQSGYLKYL